MKATRAIRTLMPQTCVCVCVREFCVREFFVREQNPKLYELPAIVPK
jgi:hypothetical protein